MRSLTIRREKSFVACLGKMKVYIEDQLNEEIKINGVPCRKLGDLKNGEEATFFIGEEEARVFVIAGVTSKDFCNDFTTVPAGSDDVFLSGKNKYNPVNGNAFRFRGTEVTEDVKKGRRKGVIIGSVILAVAAIVGFAFGFLMNMDGPAEPKVFTVGEMSITLTDKYDVMEQTDSKGAYYTDETVVVITNEALSLFEGDGIINTKEDYADLVIYANSMENSVVLTKNGVVYFEYTEIIEDEGEFTYIATVHKSENAFWLIQFAAKTAVIGEYRDTFFEYASTVTFN